MVRRKHMKGGDYAGVQGYIAFGQEVATGVAQEFGRMGAGILQASLRKEQCSHLTLSQPWLPWGFRSHPLLQPAEPGDAGGGHIMVKMDKRGDLKKKNQIWLLGSCLWPRRASRRYCGVVLRQRAAVGS